MLRTGLGEVRQEGVLGRHGRELQRIPAVDEQRHAAKALCPARVIGFDEAIDGLSSICSSQSRRVVECGPELTPLVKQARTRPDECDLELPAGLRIQSQGRRPQG